MILKLTAQGFALLLHALEGVGIQFSKVVMGNGEKPAEYKLLSSLQNPIFSAEISSITRLEKYVILRAPMINSNFDGRLHWTELGVFVKDPAGGEDILYAYAHSDLTGDGQGISIPAHDTNMIELAQIIYVYVGDVDNVTAILAQSSEFVSVKVFNDHAESYNNPHKVTKAQVGLGLVPNVAPENQQPAFSDSVTPVTESEDGTKKLPNISNGEKMGSMLQKIRSAISALIDHLNDKNPHRINASDVGAAQSTHYHNASEITKGALGIPRGGTGAANASDARVNLGIQAGGGKIIIEKGAPCTKDIYFPKKFSKAPVVTVTPAAQMFSSDFYLGVSSVNTEYFEAWSYSGSQNIEIDFSWIACG